MNKRLVNNILCYCCCCCWWWWWRWCSEHQLSASMHHWQLWHRFGHAHTSAVSST